MFEIPQSRHSYSMISSSSSSFSSEILFLQIIQFYGCEFCPVVWFISFLPVFFYIEFQLADDWIRIDRQFDRHRDKRAKFHTAAKKREYKTSVFKIYYIRNGICC